MTTSPMRDLIKLGDIEDPDQVSSAINKGIDSKSEYKAEERLLTESSTD